MPENAYPELPELAYERTTVKMTDVAAYLARQSLAVEIKRATDIIFRNESANGGSGVNWNFVGAQADSGRWPTEFDAAIVGTVVEPENQTDRVRRFVAFRSWTDSVDFLADRVARRGLYVGGTTHLVLVMPVHTPTDLAVAYHRDWVTGSASSYPSQQEIGNFLSMYNQAAVLFPENDAPAVVPPSTPAPVPLPPLADESADALNAAEEHRIEQGETT